MCMLFCACMKCGYNGVVTVDLGTHREVRDGRIETFYHTGDYCPRCGELSNVAKHATWEEAQELLRFRHERHLEMVW